jgi:hypothetical protein
VWFKILLTFICWRNIKRENRICNLCNGRNLGDEFHYLFEYPSLSNERKKYFEPHFINRPNILKFCNLMNSKSVNMIHYFLHKNICCCWYYYIISANRLSKIGYLQVFYFDLEFWYCILLYISIQNQLACYVICVNISEL